MDYKRGFSNVKIERFLAFGLLDGAGVALRCCASSPRERVCLIEKHHD
jgi:hypothetical protein